MAILDLTTDNENMSWVIFKNPETQREQAKPFTRDLRKGKVYGWYKNAQSFRIWFREGNAQSSFYKNLDNNYLNQSSFNCSYVYCSMIHEMLAATLKQEHEKDIVAQNEIHLSAVQITLPSVMNFFIKYFADKVTIKAELLAKKVYSLTFSGKVSLYYLLNLVQVFCLIQSIEDRNIYIDLSEAALKKYALSLKKINAPYFIVYLFISRCVPDKNSFLKIRDELTQPGWTLNYGNTQKQRFDAIRQYIQNGESLQDLGCGELYYSRQFSGFYDHIDAWDADTAIQTRNQKFIEKKNLQNITLKGAFEENQTVPVGSDILITEMLEHMPREKSAQVLKHICSLNFRRLIITLPNSEFNQFYKLEQEFRHDDHFWEPTFSETEEWIHGIVDDSFKKIIKPVGDGINGIHVSTLVVIEKK